MEQLSVTCNDWLVIACGNSYCVSGIIPAAKEYTMTNKFQIPAKVVSVINMKGGVGKTTISANVFREIFRDHTIGTLLVDFDPQFNLSQLLLSRAKYEHIRTQRKTIYHVMEPSPPDSVFAISDADTTNVCNADDFTYPLMYFPSTPEIKLKLVPGDFEVSMFNLREDPKSLALPRMRFKSFIDNAAKDYNLIVLDCNPSSSFLTRCAIESSTHILIPVRPDKYSVLGVEMIYKYIARLPTLQTPPKVMILLNDTADHSDVESQLRGHETYGPDTLVRVLPKSRILMSSTKYSGFATDRHVSHRHVVELKLKAIAKEIAEKMGFI